MGLLLRKIDDPRDSLEKAKRSELFAFAKQNNVAEIDTDNMPAIIMRQILRSKGLTNIEIPHYRQLGKPDPNPSLLNSKGRALTTADQSVPDKGVEANAVDDLMRQYQAQKNQPAENAKPADPKRDRWRGMKLKDMGINEKRWAAKAHGLHLTRKTNMAELTKFLREKGLQ